MPALTYTPADFVPFTKILSADVNSKFTSIQTLLNTTKLDDTNIQDVGITGSTKLKLLSVTTAVINDLAVTGGKIANETITDGKISTAAAVGSILRADGTAGADFTSPTYPIGFTWNIGVTLSGGTLKICQANGSVFSTGTAAGAVNVPSTTVGLNELMASTSDIHFIDTDDIRSLFGSTTGVAWGNDRPFPIYACNTSVGLRYFLALDPTLKVTPSSANDQGYNGVASTNTTQNSIHWMSDTNLTAETSRPCVMIGWAAFTKSAGDRWNGVTLTSAHGIGKNFFSASFLMPNGQNGNHTGRKIFSTGTAGNLPTFTTEQSSYRMDMSGFCKSYFAWTSLTVAGADNGTLQIGLPYSAASSSGYPSVIGIIGRYIATSHPSATIGLVTTSEGYHGASLITISSHEGANNVTANDFTAAGDRLQFTIEFPAFQGFGA